MKFEKEEDQAQENINTRIWHEEAEQDDPFITRACYCAGYDVYGELLYKASWIEYLYLLFKLERPADREARLLERLAIALANPGPRDYSVRAAMSAAAGGSTAASLLMAALAVGAGQAGGAREIHSAMLAWSECGLDLARWKNLLGKQVPGSQSEIWPEREYPAGFEPHGSITSLSVVQTLDCLADIYSGGTLAWLQKSRPVLEEYADRPLAMTAVASAAFADLALSPDEAEMMYLLLRLPGAAAHGLEQHMQWKKYPFFKNGLVLTDDPGPIKENSDEPKN
jgi:citrate synthase